MRGWAIVVGRTNAYVNITDDSEKLLVSLDCKDMEKIVKAWVKARGGYPE